MSWKDDLYFAFRKKCINLSRQMVMYVQFLQQQLIGIFLWEFLKIFICLNKANLTRKRKSPRKGRDGHAIKQFQNKYSDSAHGATKDVPSRLISYD
jgi:hypothetical protein